MADFILIIVGMIAIGVLMLIAYGVGFVVGQGSERDQHPPEYPTGTAIDSWHEDEIPPHVIDGARAYDIEHQDYVEPPMRHGEVFASIAETFNRKPPKP